MCMSLHPSKMTGTKIYAGEADLGGTYAHVLAYQNVAETHAPGPNAMVLPIPAVTLGPKNTVDTRKFKDFLSNIINATRSKSRSLSRGVGEAFGLSKSVQVFDVGSYTVVLARNPSAIVDGLASVPEDKRPALNETVIASFAANYPGWPIAVCCWNGSIKPEPLLWWYEPLDPSTLFAPTLDAHDGSAPRRGSVHTDHYLTFGSTIQPQGEAVRYYQEIPTDVTSFLPTQVVGGKLDKILPNGDVYMNVQGLRDSESVKAYRKFPGTDWAPVALNAWE